MSATWSMYDPATGQGFGATFTGPDWMVSSNTPPGAAAYCGTFNPECERIVLVTDDMGDQQPVVVDWVPPAPADDEWRTWSWSEQARRWTPAPTLAALKRDATAPLQRQIEAIELEQARPQRELLAALLAGEPAPAQAQQRLSEIEAAIVPLRARRAAIAAATTVEALQQILNPET